MCGVGISISYPIRTRFPARAKQRTRARPSRARRKPTPPDIRHQSFPSRRCRHQSNARSELVSEKNSTRAQRPSPANAPQISRSPFPMRFSVPVPFPCGSQSQDPAFHCLSASKDHRGGDPGSPPLGLFPSPRHHPHSSTGTCTICRQDALLQ